MVALIISVDSREDMTADIRPFSVRGEGVGGGPWTAPARIPSKGKFAIRKRAEELFEEVPERGNCGPPGDDGASSK